MKRSGRVPKQGGKEHAQKYCQYIIDPETGAMCGELLLGKGRASQGRRKYCVAHSELADRESRKQNGALWVRHHRTRQPDSSRFSDNIRKTKDKIMDFLSSSAVTDNDDTMWEFHDYCEDNKEKIGKWFRYELNFAHTAFEVGYPDTTSIAVTQQPKNLYVITLQSQLRPYRSLLPSRPCSPECHFPNGDNKMRYSVHPGKYKDIINGEIKQIGRSVEVLFRSGFLLQNLTITQYEHNYWGSLDALYSHFTASCRTVYPVCSIISIRGVTDKNRLIMVTTSTMPQDGLVGHGFGEVGDVIASNFMMEDYKRPPSVDYGNGFCPLSLPDLSYLNSGFRYRYPTTILYRGEEVVVRNKRRGDKKAPKKK